MDQPSRLGWASWPKPKGGSCSTAPKCVDGSAGGCNTVMWQCLQAERPGRESGLRPTRQALPGGCWAGADHRHMCKLCWTLVVVASTVWGSWGPRISGRVKTAKSAAAEFPTVGKTHQPVGKTHRLVGAISAVGDSAVGTRFRDTVSGNPEIPKISCTLYIKGEVPRDVKFPRKPGATAPGMDGQAPSPGGAVAM